MTPHNKATRNQTVPEGSTVAGLRLNPSLCATPQGVGLKLVSQGSFVKGSNSKNREKSRVMESYRTALPNPATSGRGFSARGATPSIPDVAVQR